MTTATAPSTAPPETGKIPVSLPRSKPIEERFNQLQYAGDNVRGFCGRAERYDRPEAVADLVEACKAGKVHPRGQLLHISEYREHLTGVMGSLNSERNDGKTLRGQTPDEINRLFASEPADRPIDFAEAFAAANAEKPQPQQSWGTNDNSDRNQT